MSEGIVVVEHQLPEVRAEGAWEGASRTSRELASHRPSFRSADADLLHDKDLIDARTRDNVRNNGYLTGASNTFRDSIVGSQFMLNANPRTRHIKGGDDTWAEEFQLWAETRFTLFAESSSCWIDCARKETLTGLARQTVVGELISGEELTTAEWIRDQPDRPYKTCLQRIDPDRLSNPRGTMDNDFLRGGIEYDRYGAPLAAHIRESHPGEMYASPRQYNWKRVLFRKPWGRIQVIHLFEGFRPDQSRGVSNMVSVLKQIRMTSRFQDVTLQNAVVQATYAATIESELPKDVAFNAMGAVKDDNEPAQQAINYLRALISYGEDAKNVKLDGVKIPYLFPGSKLQLRPAGTAGGVGTGFEQSLLRHIAAALGVSYEQLSRDYSNVNYSSARATMNETYKFMQSRKKAGADRFAGHAYELWLEEEWNRQDTDMPRRSSWSDDYFYEPLVKEALTACSWIGSSRGQVDEMKETQAAVMRVTNGLSTLERECAYLGLDYREVLKQLAREKGLKKKLGLDEMTILNAMTAGKKNAVPAAEEDKKETADAED